MEPRPGRQAPAPPPAPPDGSSALDTAAVLLVLQAGLGLVSAAGVVFLTVLTGGAPLYIAASLAAIAGPVLALVLARGLTRGRRRARNGTLVFQGLILLGFAVRVVFVQEVAFGLVVTLSGIVLPLAVFGLVLSPSARRAVAATRREPTSPEPLPTTRELRPAA